MSNEASKMHHTTQSDSAGWPSTREGNKSGGGRDNAPPKKP